MLNKLKNNISVVILVVVVLFILISFLAPKRSRYSRASVGYGDSNDVLTTESGSDAGSSYYEGVNFNPTSSDFEVFDTSESDTEVSNMIINTETGDSFTEFHAVDNSSEDYTDFWVSWFNKNFLDNDLYTLNETTIESTLKYLIEGKVIGSYGTTAGFREKYASGFFDNVKKVTIENIDFNNGLFDLVVKTDDTTLKFHAKFIVVEDDYDSYIDNILFKEM